MDLERLSDQALLRTVIGVKKAARLYEGSLFALLARAVDGDPAVYQLAACKELLRRSLLEQLRGREAFPHPQAVKEYLRVRFAGLAHEVFSLLLLDTQHRLLDCVEVSRGTLDGATVYPREVVKVALRHNAAAVILCHNHPSGVSEPSAADRVLTEKLRQALGVIDIRTLDHLVVAASDVTSFAERGWL